MMSEPSVVWMSSTRSGEKKCLVPSIWEVNSTPASVILRMWASEKT